MDQGSHPSRHSGRRDDESDLEELRAMLFQAGKLAELGTQMASLVHEMNQPLVAIKAFAQMIKGAVTDEATRRRSALIEEQADVLARLVGRIRLHARKGAGVETSDCREAAVRAAELMEHATKKAGVDLELDLDPGPLAVPLDEVHTQQILVNLISNAVDALEHESERRVRISVWRSPDWVWLTVADSGPGIPEDIVGRVLDPFFTTKDPEKGTGLGLSICREIARSCGGSLSIRSGDSIGAMENGFFRTLVEVKLPAAADLPSKEAEGETE